MDKLVDHLFILKGGGEYKDFNGSYSEYKIASRNEANSSPQKVKEEPKPEAASDEPEKRKLNYHEKKEYSNLEDDIAKLEKRKKEIEALFLDGTLEGDKITELSQELGNIQKEIEEKEDRWLELSEFV